MNRLLNSWIWLGLLVTLASVAPWLVPEQTALVLPRSLGPLALRHSVSGSEAAVMVNRMHGRQVAEAQNAIGYYSSGRGGAVLYVTLYGEAFEARQGEERMGAKIATGDFVFQGFRRGVVDGKPVAACSGFGQEHFIFSHRRTLYWLAVHPSLAEDAVRSLIASLQ